MPTAQAGSDEGESETVGCVLSSGSSWSCPAWSCLSSPPSGNMRRVPRTLSTSWSVTPHVVQKLLVSLCSRVGQSAARGSGGSGSGFQAGDPSSRSVGGCSCRSDLG